MPAIARSPKRATYNWHSAGLTFAGHFYEIAAGGDAPIATEALKRIADLYAIEAEMRGRSADERRNVRQDRTRPLVEALKTWMEVKLAAVSQKGKVAEAIRYALSRWDGLCRFIEDGRVEINSNIVERAIRPLAINRKNALFAGSDGGGEHWAILASLIETCKLNNVDPEAYLTDVLARLVEDHPANRLDELASLELGQSLPGPKGRVTSLTFHTRRAP